jgi:hypothetical protein
MTPFIVRFTHTRSLGPNPTKSSTISLIFIELWNRHISLCWGKLWRCELSPVSDNQSLIKHIYIQKKSRNCQCETDYELRKKREGCHQSSCHCFIVAQIEKVGVGDGRYFNFAPGPKIYSSISDCCPTRRTLVCTLLWFRNIYFAP